MTNTDNPDHIDFTESLLQEQFIRSAMEPAAENLTAIREDIQDFTASFDENAKACDEEAAKREEISHKSVNTF
ncbi:MAG: hypothetical protein AUI84_15880 [Delftia sp. 13_1_40CM_3_66_6]|nr:MAG: hypothetical protein AUI84_15880 [Delftia sp. 13_1_40CM_3_66_6]